MGDKLFGSTGKEGNSLSTSLFGEKDLMDDDIFSSDTSMFNEAVRRRIKQNETKVKRLKMDSECDNKEIPHQQLSLQELLDQRKHQSQSPMLRNVTCTALYPANDESHNQREDANDSSLPVDVKVHETADIVRSHGFVVIQNAVRKEALNEISKRSEEIECQLCSALDERGVSWRIGEGETESFRYNEVASRCKGRMDLRYETSKPPFSVPAVIENKSLLPVVHSLLGGKTAREDSQMPLLVYVGLILSFPGSDDQPWHQDGMPLFSEDDFDSSDLPPYALNIFLPLTDQDMSVEVGPTEFIPGSHIMTEQQAMSIVEGSEQTGPLTVVSPVVRSGDALIYDYRVCHRGTSNLTHVCDQGKVRKILYLMYARPWFKEHLNFGTENLFDQHDGGIPK